MPTQSAATAASSSNAGFTSSAAYRLRALDYVALVLLVVGGLNWGLIGFFNFDLVAAIFGSMSLLSRVVYSVVGLCALYTIYLMTAMRRAP